MGDATSALPKGRQLPFSSAWCDPGVRMLQRYRRSPLKLNGSSSYPLRVGIIRASLSLKIVSTRESCHSWRTESIGQTKAGTQRTLRTMDEHRLPWLSRAITGKSPIHVHLHSTPSAPYMESPHGRRLIRIDSSLTTCQTQPLSTTIERLGCDRGFGTAQTDFGDSFSRATEDRAAQGGEASSGDSVEAERSFRQELCVWFAAFCSDALDWGKQTGATGRGIGHAAA